MNAYCKLVLLTILTAGPADATEQCEPNPYRKSISVAGLQLLHPQQAVLGELYNVGGLFAQLIAAKINEGGRHQAYDLSKLGMESSTWGERRYAGEALPDSQFILSGVVESMGAEDKRAMPFFKRQLRSAMSLFGRERNQPRQLAVGIVLTNRYTGQVVLRKSYLESGNWRHGATRKIGVNNPRFWQVEYGQRAGRLLTGLVADVQQAMGCQPLMARIESVRQGVIRFSTPPHVLLQPGSELQLLKVNRDNPTEPANSPWTARVTAVEMRAAEAVFVQSKQGNIQMGDLVMAL